MMKIEYVDSCGINPVAVTSLGEVSCRASRERKRGRVGVSDVSCYERVGKLEVVISFIKWDSS